MKLNRNIDTLVGQFILTPGGVMNGSFDCGVELPANSIVESFYIRVIQGIPNAGAITFDLIDNSVNPSTTNIGALLQTTQSFPYLQNPGTIVYGTLGAGFNYNTGAGAQNNVPYAMQSAQFNSDPQSIGISLSGGYTIISGQILFVCKYTSFDF